MKKVGGLGTILLLAKLVGKLLKSKILFFIISTILSLVAYSYFYGILLAIALITLLVMHEGFHGVAMKAFGYKVSKIALVPFVGAVIVPETSFKKSFHEAIIALAGPALSLIVIFLVITTIPALGMESKQVLGVCYIGTLLNLFNLIPMYPLDGGRVFASAIFTGSSKSRIVTGIISIITLIIVGIFLRINPIIIIICILGMLELISKKQESMSLHSRIIVLSLYILAIAIGAYELIEVESRLGISILEVLRD